MVAEHVGECLNGLRLRACLDRAGPLPPYLRDGGGWLLTPSDQETGEQRPGSSAAGPAMHCNPLPGGECLIDDGHPLNERGERRCCEIASGEVHLDHTVPRQHARSVRALVQVHDDGDPRGYERRQYRLYARIRTGQHLVGEHPGTEIGTEPEGA